MNWDDIKAFAAVAQHGGLSAAAERLDSSAATLGRHIARLEESLGQRLFDRSALGYALTEAGHELLAEVEPMEEAAASIARWRDGHIAERIVRISAGSWMSRFLVAHWSALHRETDPFTLAFVAAEERIDIARHRADIGIRNARPVEANLAGRALATIAFAAYRLKETHPIGWIASAAATPSANWVRVNHGHEITVEANSPRLVMELCEKGAGLAVLPCFAGDTNPQLERASDILDALTHKQWLVAHHEARHQSAVRTIIRRIEGLLKEKRSVLAGSGP